MAKRTGNPKRNGVAGTIASPRAEFLTAAEVAEVWTMAAMESAEPYPMPEVSVEPTAENARAALAQGEEIAGTPPEDAAAEGPDTAPAATSGGYNYPGPYTRHEVPQALYGVYPWITVGKVFFKQNGVSYVGSAASIGNHAIWTAGHIVHAGNNLPTGWSTDMIFVPAYRDGQAPYGQWKVAFMRTRTEWFQKGNPGGLYDDMAGAVLYPLNGKKISQVVGALGIAYNVGRFQHWRALGYPQAAPFNGQRMHDTQASYAYDGTVAGSVKPVAIGCDMTGGCSGGPWITKLLSQNLLNGNNSYRQTTRPEEMNSPYFDSRAKSLWDQLTAANP